MDRLVTFLKPINFNYFHITPSFSEQPLAWYFNSSTKPPPPDRSITIPRTSPHGLLNPIYRLPASLFQILPSSLFSLPVACMAKEGKERATITTSPIFFGADLVLEEIICSMTWHQKSGWMKEEEQRTLMLYVAQIHIGAHSRHTRWTRPD